MKKGLMLLLMLTLCIGICIFAVGCGDGDDGGTGTPTSGDGIKFNYYSAEDGYVVVACTAPADKSIRITVPDEYNGKPVIGIAEGVFDKYSANITGVVLSKNLKYIADNVFSGCSKINSITLPDTVVSIGEGAFRGCSSLRDINIPAGVTEIKPYTFYGCSSLGKAIQSSSGSEPVSSGVSISGSITHIGTGAFGECTSLSSIKLSDKLVFIGENAFSGSSVTRTEGGLVYVDITDGSNLGSWLVGIESDVVAADIADGTVGVAIGAIKDIDVSSISIPASTEIIPEGAFFSLGQLSSISVAAENPIYRSEGGCLIVKDSGTLILGSSQAVIPDDVTAIGDGAFCGCTSLTSIVIPDSVTSIGKNAFFGCTSLGRDGAAVSIGAGISSIPEGCFSGCISLSSFTVPEGITAIGEGAFSDCTSLTEIIIPDAVTVIEARSFNGCSALTSVDIGSGAASIGASAFNGCSALETVTFSAGNSLTYIGESAFEHCSSLDAFDIPATVVTLERSAFRYCTKLESISLPNSLTSIGKECFKNCTRLSSVSFSSGLSTVPASCFENCGALTSVVIPEGVTSIEEAAFASCGKLNTVQLPISMVSLVKSDPSQQIDSAFSGCFALRYIFYNGGSESWYANDLHSGVSNSVESRVYFYSEEQPNGEMEPADGKTMPKPWYWHSVNGERVIW